MPGSIGHVTPAPHLDELVRRLRLDDPSATLDVGRSGTGTVVWREPRVGHPLVLVAREQDLATAVTRLGEECRDALWPDATIQAAGFNLLLVHVDEIVSTRDTIEPLRIDAGGLVWPEAVLPPDMR